LLSDHFAYRVRLAGVVQGCLESFAHRRNHLGFERSESCE
jgi:hypothetical protein